MLSRIVRVVFLLGFLGIGSQSVAEDVSSDEVQEADKVSENRTNAGDQSFGQKVLEGVSDLFKLNRDDDDAAREEAKQASRALFQEIQSLKNEAVDLNAELRLLEEELLFPVNTQVTFFVSMETEELFQLESVRLKLDGQDVASHLYQSSERQAMTRGGMHRLHIANLSNGPHELTAVFTGVGPSGRDYERAVSESFEKRTGARYFELLISDSSLKNQPEFQVLER